MQIEEWGDLVTLEFQWRSRVAEMLLEPECVPPIRRKNDLGAAGEWRRLLITQATGGDDANLEHRGTVGAKCVVLPCFRRNGSECLIEVLCAETGHASCAFGGVAIAATGKQAMSNRKQVGLVLAGAGAVGSNLLRVVERKFSQALAAQLQLVVVAIGDSRGFVVRNSGLSWDHVRNLLAHKASGGSVTSWTGDTDVGIQPSIHASLLQVVEQLHAHGECDKYVLIDCTSSQAIAPALVRGKQLGFAVIMANKLPLSGESEVYDQLVFTDDNRRSPLVQYEATVGAGLPVITTLRRIVASCDTISSVQGSFSGTIGYVLAEMNRCVVLLSIHSDRHRSDSLIFVALVTEEARSVLR